MACLTLAPILALIDPTQPFEVVGDASGLGTGAVLLQNGRPVTFHSYKFNSAERNYSPGEQELFVVLFESRKWCDSCDYCDWPPTKHIAADQVCSAAQQKADSLDGLPFKNLILCGSTGRELATLQILSAGIQLCYLEGGTTWTTF